MLKCLIHQLIKKISVGLLLYPEFTFQSFFFYLLINQLPNILCIIPCLISSLSALEYPNNAAKTYSASILNLYSFTNKYLAK